jgi:hypothetical protein
MFSIRRCFIALRNSFKGGLSKFGNALSPIEP